MSRAQLMVCKAFLSGYPADAQQAFASLLPRNDQVIFAELPSPAPMEKLERIKGDLLKEIHPSWLAPYLRTLGEGDLRLFLASLTTEERKGMEKVLGFSNGLAEVSKLAKSHFRKTLLEQMTQNQELIPRGCLPDHPLNHLLDLTRAKLESLVHFLGLHDLSFEMRQIIATKKLKAIFHALPKKEGEYLQSLILHREPLVFQRLFLERWDGTKEIMAKLLIERGAERLACALLPCDSSLTWYVTHKLDMHTGTLVLKHKDKPAHARADLILVKQVEKIVKLLEPHEAV